MVVVSQAEEQRWQELMTVEHRSTVRMLKGPGVPETDAYAVLLRGAITFYSDASQKKVLVHLPLCDLRNNQRIDFVEIVDVKNDLPGLTIFGLGQKKVR